MKPEYGVLTYINTADISPHKDNPRKNLGDLTELAESIKVSGVLQNLTVVPIYGELTHEFNGKYTVVIGHRRLAAAKLAGIETVPCIVSDMTGMQQIRTMLTENMQRSDLTVYEEAQGFQMMLDLGDSVADISERTGFSSTTVRRRVKLLELDQDKFKKAEKRGATLMDYAKLEEIEDVEARNKVLDVIGTNNFQRELQSALDDQKWQKRKEGFIEVIKTFATEDPEASYSTKRYVMNYSRWSNNETVEVPADADTVKYYYKESDRSIDIYKDIYKAAEDAEQAKRAEERRKQDAIEEQYVGIREDHYSLRAEFVKGLSNAACKKSAHQVIGLLADVAYFQPDLDIEALGYVLGIELSEDDEDECFMLSEVPGIMEAAKSQPDKLAFCLAYCAADSDRSGYWHKFWNCGRYDYEHAENQMLDRVYETLEHLGYEMSDDEKDMQSGCHSLFLGEDDVIAPEEE